MEIYNYYGLLKSILFPKKVHTISILWPSMDFQIFLQCITPADKVDKGRVTVVMDKSEYHKKWILW
jgi:hypothetical protein